jgi:succinate dehydrogenase flavin-adding protein (antitoxin of CptAB toxin-antitoxin module)
VVKHEASKDTLKERSFITAHISSQETKINIMTKQNKNITAKQIKKAFDLFIQADDEQVSDWLSNVKWNNPGEALREVIEKILTTKSK